MSNIYSQKMSDMYSEDILNDPHRAGWVGASIMPSPVVRFPSEQSIRQIDPWATEPHNKRFSSKLSTPATEISLFELPPQENKIEFENPSLAHGAKDAIIGKIKETIGKITRRDYLRESGRDQKRWGKREFKAATKAESAESMNRKLSVRTI
ncbi:hypothetical protein F8M41_013098 [Gigaspora margarita]|uniref:Uncharacterized protein n=1 Tax=Gigaspora margarita TaxID=4874 RepID=A0A8H3WYR7_GIGMA|nr:hypothetical protein F8M41_013098 [Gigaspora margarita]